MATQILETANECIHCGNKDDLRDEHIIAYSLGGNIILPKASRKQCAVVTGKLEQDVARGTYHFARAIHRAPTRRPKEYPTTTQVEVMYGPYGPKKIVEISIERAPLYIWAPWFSMESFDDKGILSRSFFRVLPLEDEKICQRKQDSLLRSFGAYSVKGSPVSIRLKSFHRVLWKIALGGIYMHDRTGAKSSNLSALVLGLEEGAFGPGPNFLVRYITSAGAFGGGMDSKLAVWTEEIEGHAFYHVDIEFFRAFGLPRYCCLIPNPDRTPINESRF